MGATGSPSKDWQPDSIKYSIMIETPVKLRRLSGSFLWCVEGLFDVGDEVEREMSSQDLFVNLM